MLFRRISTQIFATHYIEVIVTISLTKIRKYLDHDTNTFVVPEKSDVLTRCWNLLKVTIREAVFCYVIKQLYQVVSMFPL